MRWTTVIAARRSASSHSIGSKQRRDEQPDDEQDGALRALEDADRALEVDRLGSSPDVGRHLRRHQRREREQQQSGSVGDGPGDPTRIIPSASRSLTES
jgi:hypothetical protein